MNWQQLEYFKTIAETENFTEAAIKLSVSQPALSKAIAKLEDELAVPLFEKQGRNIKLSRYGSVFLKHTQAALTEINYGIQELTDMINPHTGTISISSLHTIGTRLIPEAVGEFLDFYPNIKFEYCMEKTENIIRGLKNGQFDLGLYDDIDENITLSDVDSIVLKKDELVVIVPNNHPFSNKTEVSFLDLKDENFIFYSEKIKAKVSAFYENHGLTPKSSLNPNDNSMIVAGFVRAGLGISIIPRSTALKAENISIISAKEKPCFRTLYLGWKKSSPLSASASLFKDFLIEFIAKNKCNT